MAATEPEALRHAVIAALRTVQDPEIPVNLYDLGLIYQLDVGPDGTVRIVMTLTTPNCPVAEAMPGRVKAAAESVAGVRQATVELVWEPPWSRERMSEDARMALEMMGVAWSDTRPGMSGLTIGRTGKKRPGG